MLSKRAIVAVSLLAGAGLELGVSAATGRREAWDSGLFWAAGLPLTLILAALLGYLARGDSWRWTACIMPAQFLTMAVRGGEVPDLWPVGLFFTAVLTIPVLLAAYVGSRWRRRATPAA